jgi:GH15 family glucan-1,4-alpha-glucosidase
VEALSGDLELFAEEADPRDDEMLGNYPLLFSQVEYIRAVLTLSKAKAGPTSVRIQAGMNGHQSAPE